MKKQHFLKVVIYSVTLCTLFSLCGCKETTSKESSEPTQMSTIETSPEDFFKSKINLADEYSKTDNSIAESTVSQTELTQIDPFENLTFTYTGVSPYIAVATDISKCNDTIQNYVDFQLSKSENVRNGDTITVTAVCDDRLFNAGYALSNTSKDYDMKDLPEFVKSTDGLYLNELQSQMDDKREAFTATNDGANKFADCWLTVGAEGFDSVKSTVLKSTYLLSLKNSFEDKHINDRLCYNRYIQIYDYVVNRKNNAEPVNIYVVVYADNVYKDNTGTVFWDYQIDAEGYDNYNDLVNEYITKEKEFYNSTNI